MDCIGFDRVCMQAECIRIDCQWQTNFETLYLSNIWWVFKIVVDFQETICKFVFYKKSKTTDAYREMHLEN